MDVHITRPIHVADGADSSGAAEAATTPEAEQSPDNNGLCARALYDYQAGTKTVIRLIL